MKTSFQKVNLDTENVKSRKLSKKNLLKSKNCFAKIHKKLAETFWTKNFFALDFPRDS